MTANDFSDVLWDQIEQAAGNEDRLKSLLMLLPKDALIVFHKEFRRALYNLWRASDAGGWYEQFGPDEEMSEDGYEDIFAYVVSQGKRYYDEILSHPDRLRWNIEPGDVPFLGVAGEVFWERFQDEITLQ